MNQLPSGKLVCCGVSWYRSDGRNKTYIKKKDKDLAEKLAIKKYLSALIEDLEKEKIATEMYLRHAPKAKKVDNIFSGHDTLQELLSPYLTPLSKNLDDWMKSPYIKNLKHPDHLTHKVATDEFVRSKSEAMIAQFLKQHKIPYRYECQIVLDDMEIYPDFTIRHPRTGKFFIWEHFGLMDNPKYVKNVLSKLHTYTSNNFLPGINLITTYETKDEPLTFEMVEMLVNYYFL